MAADSRGVPQLAQNRTPDSLAVPQLGQYIKPVYSGKDVGAGVGAEGLASGFLEGVFSEYKIREARRKKPPRVGGKIEVGCGRLLRGRGTQMGTDSSVHGVMGRTLQNYHSGIE